MLFLLREIVNVLDLDSNVSGLTYSVACSVPVDEASLARARTARPPIAGALLRLIESPGSPKIKCKMPVVSVNGGLEEWHRDVSGVFISTDSESQSAQSAHTHTNYHCRTEPVKDAAASDLDSTHRKSSSSQTSDEVCRSTGVENMTFLFMGGLQEWKFQQGDDTGGLIQAGTVQDVFCRPNDEDLLCGGLVVVSAACATKNEFVGGLEEWKRMDGAGMGNHR